MCPCEQSLVCGFQKMKDMTTLVIQDYHQSNISRACAAGIADGYVFRPVNRAGQAQGDGLSEKVVWQLLQPYALAAGVPGIAPHDCRRYAECRIMPNRQRCGHARMVLDTARCGIVLAMPVLRVGR